MPNKDSGIDPETLVQLAESMHSPELTVEKQDAMHARARARIEAKSPAGTHTIRSHEGDWQTVMPLVDMKVLRKDIAMGRHTVLYRMHPGARFPTHSHTQVEECLVLEGEINLGDFYVRAGDMHIAEPGSEHREIQSKTGALLLISAEIAEIPAV